MRILYVAAGIPLPGTVGGATHVGEVSRGLAALGHELLVVAGASGEAPAGRGPWVLPDTAGRVRVVNVGGPKALSLGLYPLLAALAREFRPDVVMERYYNFAGAGLLYARRHRLGALLEVNAPVYDPPGSPKDRLDRALGRPLRRWAAWQVRAAGRIVTPLATTVGRFASAAQIVELPWGANTERFDPAALGPDARAASRARLSLPPDALVAVFAGSFRPWHGVGAFLTALRELLPRRPELWALLLGDGPERPALLHETRQWGEFGHRVRFTGRVAYADVPRYLAAADVGVAPFEPDRHPALRHFGFYWSPLKVFEYGALALPTVCPALPPLDTIVRDGREGWLYPVGDAASLTAALATALDHPRRAALGRAARERVVAHYSWAAHCRALDAILRCLAR